MSLVMRYFLLPSGRRLETTKGEHMRIEHLRSKNRKDLKNETVELSPSDGRVDPKREGGGVGSWRGPSFRPASVPSGC